MRAKIFFIMAPLAMTFAVNAMSSERNLAPDTSFESAESVNLEEATNKFFLKEVERCKKNPDEPGCKELLKSLKQRD